MSIFKLNCKYKPSGDQPAAIDKLCKGVTNGVKDQVLMGVTGSGKTFTVANIIQNLNRPALIMAHNKTLAAQLYGEFKEFFPDNAVEYFVSYYDYYQPEAYIPRTDVFIEKDSSINDQIDMLRHSATRSILERRDSIIVSSVSCIYGLGDADNYGGMKITVNAGTQVSMDRLIDSLVMAQYERNDMEIKRGAFRVKGDIIDIFPSHLENVGWRMSFFGDDLEEISAFDPVTGLSFESLETIAIYPNKHFVATGDIITNAIEQITEDMAVQIKHFRDTQRFIEAQRIEERTRYDMEMLRETGMCKGIENYSRYLDGRNPGEPPPTLFSYLPDDAIVFVDESHITTPQIGGMYHGDRSRKENLVNYGFRLPSALDNRPLKFDEWDSIRKTTVFISATPGKIEMEKTQGVVVEQIIRPTGLLDPICEIRPTEFQVDDMINECTKMKAVGLRVLALTLTKKMAERLNAYLHEVGVKSAYLHSDIEVLDRIKIIQSLRNGEIDVIVGINLLREGIDIPECGVVAILDADKEGFLRNDSSLIQMIGRAARNSNGRVILYADKETKSIKSALEETIRRRKIQEDHNTKYGITPTTIIKPIKTLFEELENTSRKSKKNKGQEILEEKSQGISPADMDMITSMTKKEFDRYMAKLTKDMKSYAKKLEFEEAAEIKQKLNALNKLIMS